MADDLLRLLELLIKLDMQACLNDRDQVSGALSFPKNCLDHAIEKEKHSDGTASIMPENIGC